jgi:hypothetical protein
LSFTAGSEGTELASPLIASHDSSEHLETGQEHRPGLHPRVGLAAVRIDKRRRAALSKFAFGELMFDASGRTAALWHSGHPSCRRIGFLCKD